MEKHNIKDLIYIRKLYARHICENPAFAVFLDALSNETFKSQHELSNFIGCNKAHTCRTLVKMQKCGYVDAKTICLTEKGKLYAQTVQKRLKQLEEKLVVGIEKEDLKTFTKVMNVMLKNAKLMEEKDE